MKKVAALIGSLRKNSINRAIYNFYSESVKKDFDLTEIKIGDLPLYNQDLGDPDQVRDFCSALDETDAIIFFSPEYNYTIPGVLKNAFDWASKHDLAPLKNKPAAIIGASPGAIGTARMQYDLRKICVPLNMFVMNKPEMVISFSSEKVKDGVLKDEDTIKRLQSHAESFSSLIDKFTPPN